MPYDRRSMEAPKPWSTVRDRNGTVYEGLNFATSDYLGLATHPKVKGAAVAAIQRFGTHSAATAALAGMTDEADALALALGKALHQPYVSLHSSGWAAGYDAMRAFVRPGDAVLLDAHIGSGIFQGASAATRHVYTYRHLDLDHALAWMRKLRARRAHTALFVATSSVFAGDGACSDLSALQPLCQEFDATLAVDVAHDFGCVGPRGGGEIEVQSVLGKIDLVVGSLAKTLASNGGFIATRQADLRDYARAFSPTHVFSAALGPAQIAAAGAALSLVESPEGASRRAALRRTVLALRASLSEYHLAPIGTPGPIVAVPIGAEFLARETVRLCSERGVLLNLLEYPAAPRGKARVRLQPMAGHEPALMPEVAAKIAESVCAAQHANRRKTFLSTLDRI